MEPGVKATMHNSWLLAVSRVGGVRAALAAFGCLALAIGALFIANFAGAERLEAQAARPAGGTHMGVGSCGGSTCHGRNEADGEVVRQDELWRWQEESTPGGAHSRAFRVLGEPRSLAIPARPPCAWVAMPRQRLPKVRGSS
jgi:hypothetical protein